MLTYNDIIIISQAANDICQSERAIKQKETREGESDIIVIYCIPFSKVVNRRRGSI